MKASPGDRDMLFGADGTENVVAVEAGDDSALLYLRRDDRLTTERRRFSPWLLSAESRVEIGGEWMELPGEGRKFLATFATREHAVNARRALRSQGAPVLSYGSMEKQFLAQSGVTLFKGMSFDDPRRLQFDLETETLDPSAPNARILLAALRDNRGFEIVLDGEEEAIVQGIVDAIHERDPDVIEGHNLFGFDIPYLLRRAARVGVGLFLGRDGSAPVTLVERRCAIGGMSRPFTPVRIHGRHLIDTLFAAQRFDWARGEWESYSLKEVAKALGVSEESRIRVDRAEMIREIGDDPERVREYAMQDARETARILRIVGATDFFATQMVPDTYERVAVGGTGEKVESLMVRTYLARGEAIPLGQESRSIPGGYTECRRVGVLSPVVKVDVESLYPSLMLTRQIAPRSDRLGVFLPMLRDLTARRLSAKATLRTVLEEERPYWDGLQGAFKILINSFYGYLCAGTFSFNDYDAAAEVTRNGREIVRQIALEIESRGGKVIEIDTDGVYYQPPADQVSEEDNLRLTEEVGNLLPVGIRLSLEGSYAAMVSLKMKNYALVGHDGRVTYRGSALRSRSDERFGRDFISGAIDRLVAGDPEGMAALYRDTLARIFRGEMKPEEFVRRERVTENTFGAVLRDRWSGLLPHVKVGDFVRVYRKRDGLLESIERYADDEDRMALADKLYKFASRLKPVLGSEFDRLIPKPKSDSGDESVSLQMSFDFAD